MGLTFLPDFAYTVVVFIGFALFGLGLGIYATPSTDTSVSNAPADKVGQAAGVYKMASSLGGAFRSCDFCNCLRCNRSKWKS